MVKLLVTALLLMAASATAAAPRIVVLADKTDLVLGEALTVEIRISGVDVRTLDTLTLDALQSQFDVAAVSRNVRPQSAIITATLYPLRPGAQSLPMFTLAGASSAPLALTVRESGPQVPRVLIRTGIEPVAPRVREAALLTLDVLDNGSLQWAPVAAPDAPGMHLRALAESQHEEIVDGTKFVVHRHAWAALPLRDGTLRVNFPRINATKFGVRLRYAPPLLAFAAEPVPAWLPVHLPIGALRLTSDPLPDMIEVQRPFNWQLRVTGAGVSEQGIAKVIGGALRSNESVFFYPPTVHLAEAPRVVGSQQSFLVTIPLRVLHSGDVDLPRIAFPYYDTKRDQLDAVHLDASRLTAIDPVARLALRVVIGVALLLVGAAATTSLYRAVRRAQLRAAALRRVRGAADVMQLKSALLQINRERGGAPVSTLGQWMRVLPDMSADLQRYVRQLEQACYGLREHQEKLPALRAGIVTELTRVRSTIS